jgi:prevent-host-death family protein
MENIGVRELRQNASTYLERVKQGETIQVTERGVPIAVLAPLPLVKKTRVEELIEQGILTPGTGNLAEILARPMPPMDPNYSGPTLAEILDEQREDRI